MKVNKKVIQVLVPTACAVLFAILAMIKMDLSVWYDESYTAYLIQGNFGEIWNLTAVDVHPPMYYFALKVWSLVFGSSAVALRGMSIFWGVVAIFLAFYLIKRLFNMKTASVATFLMTLSPLFVRYAEEMRMYTMVLAIVLAATLVMVVAIERTKKQKEGFEWTWLLYGVLLVIGMMTHYFVAMAWMAQLVYLIYYYRRKIWRRDIILGYALAVGLFLPWLPNCLKQVVNVQGGFWVPEVSGTTLIDFVVESLTFKAEASWLHGWWAVLLGIIAVLLAVWGLKIWQKMTSGGFKDGLILLMCMTILPPVLLVLISLPPLQPMFVSRYVMYSGVMLWILIGVLVANTEGLRKWLFSGVVVAVAVFGLMTVFTRWENSEIRGIVAEISVDEEQGIVVAGTESIYYDAVFYSNDRMTVYGVEGFYTYSMGVFAPIKEYRVNLVSQLEDVPETKNMWMIVDDEYGDKVEGYETVATIKTNEHIALKLQKSE